MLKEVVAAVLQRNPILLAGSEHIYKRADVGVAEILKKKHFLGTSTANLDRAA